MNCKHEECPLLSASLIPLTKSRYAIVDTEDYAELSKYKWTLANMEYGDKAYRNSRHHPIRPIYMHREILELKKGDGKYGDHINHNTLDNRKNELRVCTQSQNNMNSRKRKNCTSIYKGVCWKKQFMRWDSYIMVNQKQIYIGRFKSEKMAALAYNKKAKELFGEFAYLNNIQDG